MGQYVVDSLLLNDYILSLAEVEVICKASDTYEKFSVARMSGYTYIHKLNLLSVIRKAKKLYELPTLVNYNDAIPELVHMETVNYLLDSGMRNLYLSHEGVPVIEIFYNREIK